MEYSDKNVSNNSQKKCKRNQPKKSSKSFESLKATIEKKKECNSKALEIVINLSDQTVDEDVLLKSIPHINQEHYQDIVEERAINKLCGYPLCYTKLEDIPKKQYHISTAHNKVFDITDRKNFCSNLCYKASKYLKDQILTNPLWLRDNESSTAYMLLPLQSKGGVCGDEVDLGVIYAKPDVDDNNVTTSPSPSTVENSGIGEEQKDDTEQSVSTIINKTLEKHICPKNDELLQEKQDDSIGISASSNGIVSTNNSEGVNPCDKLTHPSETMDKPECEEGTDPKVMVSKSKNKSNDSNKTKSSIRKLAKNSTEDPTLLLKNIVIKTETVLKEWFSLNTLCFLLGEEKVKELLRDKQSYIKDLNTRPLSSVDIQFYEQYLDICKKLNILEIEDMKTDSSFRDKVMNPLPDYNALKEEAKQLDLKVKMFYQGDKVQFDQNNLKDNQDNKNETSNFNPILPPVDLHAQMALRRRIVSDKLLKAVQDLQKPLGLKGLNITQHTRQMITTFLLSAHNVMLKPVQWNLISIFIVKLLSLKDTAVKEALNSSLANNHLTLILMTYSLDTGYLDRLVLWLTDIEYIIQTNI